MLGKILFCSFEEAREIVMGEEFVLLISASIFCVDSGLIARNDIVNSGVGLFRVYMFSFEMHGCLAHLPERA